MPPAPFPWRLFADTGGTFTDVLAIDPAGCVHRVKVLSTGALRATLRDVSGHRLRVDGIDGEFAAAMAGMTLRVRTVEGSTQRSAEENTEGTTGGSTGGAPSREASCRIVSASGGVLEIDGDTNSLTPGAMCEVTSHEEAPVLAARLLTRTPPGSPFPPIHVRLATTRGTNALLTRGGAPVAFFVTRGFADLLEIGTQQRPALFDLNIRRPRPLYHEVIEVDERMGADGAVVEPLRLEEVRRAARGAIGRGVRSAAVALMHSDRFPGHEQAVARALKDAGFECVSCSGELSGLIKLLPRAQTAVVEAYLAPVIRAYVEGIAGSLGAGAASDGRGWVTEDPRARRGEPKTTIHVLTSAGGLASAREFRATDSLLSGPAGGVVGAARAARASGIGRAISFDMGGTSTDVARLDPEPSLVHEHRVGDAHLVTPAVAIETVAAGGGSICTYEAGEMRVGPGSAGAMPGPACYGFGGPLTLTDVNLLLGRLTPRRFAIPIDERTASEAAAKAVLRRARADRPGTTLEHLLEGFLSLACERMSTAIRQVSTRAGYDPREYALVAFGGAGGQHACAVAGSLGMTRVLVPPDAGLLSAAGLAAACVQRFAERQVLRPLDGLRGSLAAMIQETDSRALALLAREGSPANAEAMFEPAPQPPPTAGITRRIAAMRLAGQESCLEVDCTSLSPAELAGAFRAAYQGMYGHPPSDRPIELVWLKSIASQRSGTDLDAVASVPDAPRGERRDGSPPPPALAAHHETRRAYFGGTWIDVPVHARESLAPGRTLSGPALIVESHGTTVLDPQWDARADAAGALVLDWRGGPAAAGVSSVKGESLVRLELFTSRLQGLALEMGEVLRRTAVSVNVKERLDYSCAILDREGEMIVNAPHVPVHLGSLGMCVQRVRETIRMGPGDAVVTNHPAHGGSHLPDLTVITPCFDAGGTTLIGYAASRAHHAEIGGVLPGSMPPMARTLEDEGVVIAPMHLVQRGESREEDIRCVLARPPYPSRSIDDNLADLRAAVAANRRAAESLARFAGEHGPASLQQLLSAIKDRGQRAAEDLIRRCAPGTREAEEFLDDGSRLCVRVTLDQDRMKIDFTGTSGVHPGNLNATPAIVQSAIVYVLRCLVPDDIPLNEGLTRCCEVILPTCMLSPVFSGDPGRDPPVAAGNVETSQRLVDTLLKALGVAACSQGTMNNIIFGSASLGVSFYETVCGGTGAGPGFHGTSGVHSHMTNTRITDPEILESRYPVRLRRFEVRRGSGGRGAFHGGDGARREIEFLAPMSLAVVSQHRVQSPYGALGGEPGARGAQRIVRADGRVQPLAPIEGTDVFPGDRLVLETPGGGGWGIPDAPPS